MKINSAPVVLFLFFFSLLLVGEPTAAQTAVTLPQIGTGDYQGEQGGLYPGGLNTPPAAYLAELEALAGQLAQDEQLVVLGLGMSMMQNAMSGWMPFAAGPDTNPNMIVINGAIGSNQQRWADPNNVVWDRGPMMLSQAGLTAADVDIVFYHNSWSGPSGTFPDYAQMVQASFELTNQHIVDKYPGVQLILMNSRHYGGWNDDSKQPEPFAFWESFSVKWVIEERIGCTADCGPLVAWNAYQWNAWPSSFGLPDGTIWPQSYFAADGLHLSQAGQAVSGELWHEYLSTTSFTAPWYLAAPQPTPTATATGTATATASPTATPTSTPTNTPTVTPSPTPTAVTYLPYILAPGAWELQCAGTLIVEAQFVVCEEPD